MRILLAEDSGFVRRSEVKALNKLGFEHVIEVKDGQEAIQKLKEQTDIQLIISDWVMPNMDGYELLQWVRANERYHDIPFIMATARGEKKRRAQAIEVGATGFITKPFGVGELNEIIEAIFTSEENTGKCAEKEAETTASAARPIAEEKRTLSVAYIQITDHLSLGVLKHLIETEKLSPRRFDLKTMRMPSWNRVQKALEQGEVDVAFILAPMAMDMFSFGTPIKLVLFAHKNGSTFVRKKVDGGRANLHEYFKEKTFYIPHELSVHHILAHRFLGGIGLRPGFRGMGDFDVFFEVLPPFQMIEFLDANPDACGFAVAEPFSTKAIAEGVADLLFLSGELWENHPCCVVAMREELINQDPDAVQEFANMLVEAGQFIDQKPETSAAIGVQFLDPDQTLGLKTSVLKNVLKESQGIKANDMLPVIEDLDRMQRYMLEKIGLGTRIDLEKFVDTRFAERACEGIPTQTSTIKDVSQILHQITSHKIAERGEKAQLNLEGKYLIFTLDNGEYGFNVMNVAEIIRTRAMRTVPWSPAFIRGLIDYRGAVVPVIDLRIKLGMAASQQETHEHIVILEIKGRQELVRLGIVVDTVSEIIDIQAQDIVDAPPFISQASDVDINYILGLAKMNGGARILLDAERLLGC